jgi:phospholipase/carboxylesterase/glyoxalase family protein
MSELIYRYEPGETGETLLLLHGTGGDENDLIGIGHAVMPGAALLSPRGPVLENGMPRFFRRLREGVFDLEDVKRRAAELGAFTTAKAKEYGFDPARVCAFGYSNGANIAGAMLLTGSFVFARAALVRAMVPLEPDPLPKLPGADVLISAGRYDPIATPAQTRRLAELLEGSGATVSIHEESSGHEMGRGDVEAARVWLARK